MSCVPNVPLVDDHVVRLLLPQALGMGIGIVDDVVQVH